MSKTAHGPLQFEETKIFSQTRSDEENNPPPESWRRLPVDYWQPMQVREPIPLSDRIRSNGGVGGTGPRRRGSVRLPVILGIVAVVAVVLFVFTLNVSVKVESHPTLGMTAQAQSTDPAGANAEETLAVCDAGSTVVGGQVYQRSDLYVCNEDDAGIRIATDPTVSWNHGIYIAPGSCLNETAGYISPGNVSFYACSRNATPNTNALHWQESR